MAPHSLIIETLKMIKVTDSMRRILCDTIYN